MVRLSVSAAMILVAGGFLFVTPAIAIDGKVLITQAKAQAGNVTTGDRAGFPVSLTKPGSYVLASNLSVPAGKTGIVVSATEVSIDLNGFRINGAGGTAGIGIDGHQRSLTVQNGTIRGFKSDGIRSIGALLTVDHMRIEENGGAGVIEAQSGYARIVNSVLILNGAQGIFCSDACHIEGNTTSANHLQGVLIQGKGATVLGNTIYKNGNIGLSILVGGNAAFGNNTIVDNGATQVTGSVIALFPNACSPGAC
jgi:hypothetical protein